MIKTHAKVDERESDRAIPFACPLCRRNLSDLACPEHGSFARHGDVALLAKDRQAETLSSAFDQHWNQHGAAEYPVQKLQEARRFLQPMLQHFSGADGDRPVCVLDAGAGDGVHAKVLADEGRLECVGLDISLAALLKIQAAVPTTRSLVHGDVTAMPFPDRTFDAVFSFGVLGYCSDPERGFAEMCRVTRVGGMVGVWLYPKRDGLAGAAFRAVRWLCAATGSWGAYALASAIVPFLFVLPTRSKVHLLNSTWRQCLEVVMVNIQPATLFFPTRELVLRWFADQGIDIVADDAAEPITLWGVKR